MRNLSNWRAIRVEELSVERELRRTRVLWLHGLWIGAIELALMGLASLLQFTYLPTHSLAVRYLVTLGAGYLGYLVIVRLWAAALLRGTRWSFDGSWDLPTPGSSGGSGEAAGAGARIVSGQVATSAVVAHLATSAVRTCRELPMPARRSAMPQVRRFRWQRHRTKVRSSSSL